jgi:hypothetical protein
VAPPTTNSLLVSCRHRLRWDGTRSRLVPNRGAGTSRTRTWHLTVRLADSGHPGVLVPGCARSLALIWTRPVGSSWVHHYVCSERVIQRRVGFSDVIPFSTIDYLHFPVSRRNRSHSRDHAAWSPGPGPICSACYDVFREDAAGVDLGLTAQAAASRPISVFATRLPRATARFCTVRMRQRRRLLRVSGQNFDRKERVVDRSEEIRKFSRAAGRGRSRSRAKVGQKNLADRDYYEREVVPVARRSFH